ncbi:NfeD family protein [Pseudoalteromonas fenneropenaei]|uniref:NfeD family protein n=1 Tax=Pseudoalteromonas fenneropenaei TaxID=1737459 RepID=A0ABV7CQR6_9GAMM
MGWISENLWETLAILGVLALCIEVLILGFATFVLLFLGIALIISAVVMYFGLLPETWLTALWLNAILTAVLALLLWQPLRKLQNKQDHSQVHSDFAELSFVLEADVNEGAVVHYAYSGIQWQLKSTEPLRKGQHVKVVNKEVGVLWIAAQ